MGLEDMPEVISNDGRDETLASGNMPHNRGNVPKKNHHPTVKPIKLMEYLITLITPPNGMSLTRSLAPYNGYRRSKLRV